MRSSILATTAAALLVSIIMPAQTLPQLPTDQSIRRGVLRCGINYYMSVTDQYTGQADITMVLKGTPGADIPGADAYTPDAEFLARMGVSPQPDGYLSRRDGALVARMEAAPVYRSEVLDSLLLYSFGKMSATNAPQALIISGDIDPVEIKKKMDIFSMLVPRINPEASGQDLYRWTATPAPKIELRGGKNPAVEVQYASARIPSHMMNTAQALVTDIFALEFRQLLRHRLERDLLEEGIPFREIGFSARRSADSPGDEQYTVLVETDAAHLEEAGRVIASTLASMAAFGVQEDEFTQGKDAMTPGMYAWAAQKPTNREYTDRCIASFLYGAPLSGRKEMLRLFALKEVSDSVETHLFNQFAAALPQQLSNLTLRYSAVPDSLDSDRALFRYNLGYLWGSVVKPEKDYSWRAADSLGLEPENLKKARIKSEKPEPVSGGMLWTFSNGIRVIFKPIKGSGSFSYALQMNGGLAQIPGLKEGEGGYIADMFTLYDAGGLRAPVFRDMLEAAGIKMDARVDLGNTIIEGSAPSKRLGLLLKTLVSISNERKPNVDCFEAYSRNAALARPTLEQRLESLIAPSFVYTDAKLPGALQPDTQAKAERLFEDRFSHVNDGVLIICGDLDEGYVKKLLLRYLGGFRTMKLPSASKKAVHYRSLSGSTSYAEEGYGKRGIYILLDADYPFTASNYLCGFAAREAVRRALIKELGAKGYNVDVQVKGMAKPQERLRMFISCRTDDMDADLRSALSSARKALSRLAGTPVEKQDMDMWRTLTEHRMKASLGTREGMMETLLARYANGKDLSSRYGENLKELGADKVEAMLKALTQGGRIEYIIP